MDTCNSSHVMQNLKSCTFQIIEDCEKNDISIFNPELFDLQSVVGFQFSHPFFYVNLYN